MKQNLRKLLYCLVGIVLAFHTHAQTQTTNYNVPFESGQQNMWGPSWNAFTLNINKNLFDLPWNESYNSGNGGIVSILGMQFGAAIDVSFSGRIGANLILDGFTTGTVEVEYPIDVSLVMNQDQTYDQGDTVSIQTDYTVDDTASLTSDYPSLGEIKLDVYFQFAGHLGATLCMFGCTTFDIIPSFDTGLHTLHVMQIDVSGAHFFGFDNYVILGQSFYYNYPGLPLQSSSIPNDPLGQFGLSAWLNLPYVITDDTLIGKNLSACGDSIYAQLSLDIFDCLAGVLGEIAPVAPPPADAVLEALSLIFENLANSYQFGIAEVHWNLFDAGFNVNLINNQCFNFNPTVYGKFEFPLPVDYAVYNGGGTIQSQGTSSVIDLKLGEDLKYKFPCYYEDISITPTFSIDGQFRNHTFDILSLNFWASALEIGASIPQIQITPAIHIPSICVTLGYPCGFIDWCTYDVCTPEINIPAVVFPGISFDYGPLWSYSDTLAQTSYDWFDQTWALEGFSSYRENPFVMKAKPLTSSVSVTNVSCYGNNTGAIDLSTQAVSPANPYTYTWTNGATTQDVSNLPAGSYQVEIRDAHDCPLYNGGVILQPADSVSISALPIDKLCNSGANTGSIDINVNGGTSPYTYSWSSGQTTQDISSLNAGSYTVTVTDGAGCIKTLATTINEPTLLGQVGSIQALACNGIATGEITANAYGGELPYQYSWSSGQTTSSIQNIPAGNYTLTVTDANGCINSSNYLVSQPAAALALSAVSTNILCKGDATGAIDISTMGGTAGYTYNWSNNSGVMMPNQTEDLSGLLAGTYTLNVVDQNGCQSQLTQTITEPATIMSTMPVLQDINCNGDATGQIDPSISGGTPGYGYTWSTGATSPILSSVTAGNYSLTVQDNNGCTKVFNYTLTQPASPVTLSLSNTNVKCFGDSSATITSSTSGGTQPYNYSWNTGQSSANLADLPAGNYVLNILDSKGCPQNANVTITQPAAALASTGVVTDINCYGDQTGSIALSPSGGTAPYQYQWTNGDSLILTQATPTITGLPANSYSALLTDNNGCKVRYNFTVNQPAAALSMQTDSITDVKCFGMPTGAADISIFGGTSPYSYAWSNGASSQDLSSIGYGTYYLTVTDSKGCTILDSATISQPPNAVVANATATSVKCFGGTDGTVISSVVGGISPYTYLWSNGATSNDIIGVPAGTYSLTVTDKNACVSVTGATVNQPAQALVVTPTITDVQCYGAKNGQVVITMTGGVPPYSYNWGNQDEILLNHFSETINDLDTGTYFIRVTDRNGCVNEQYLVINEPQQVKITDSIITNLCYGDSTGAIYVSVTGGTPTYTYLWSNGATTQNAGSLTSGVYTIQVTDAQACNYADTMYVSQPQQLILANSQVQEVSCEDQSDAMISVSAYGGVYPYTYLWNNGGTSNHIDSIKPASYSLLLTDANGCKANFNFVVDESEVKCVEMPNTITPNGDNYNDTWIIKNLDLYPNASVKIFNKWGNLLYDSKGKYKPWDGTYNNQPLPSEVYYYIIVLGNADDDQYTGTITIIR